MSRGAALIGALLVTLASPVTWLLSLGAFLIRGGVVLVALPVVVLPTTASLGNMLGPTLSSLALGSVPGEVVAAVAVGGLLGGLWLLSGGWLAAAMEAEAIRIVARDEDVVDLGGLEAVVERGTIPPAVRGDARVAGRILAARLVSLVPFSAALVWGMVRLVAVTYRELTSPLEVATPIWLRIVGGMPEVVIVLGLAWMAGEIVGGLAARRIVLRGDGVGRALRGALGSLARQPLTTLVRFWLPVLALAAILVPVALAAASAWSAARTVLGESGDPTAVLLVVLLFVLLWAIGLLLGAVVCAWRGAVWTVAVVIEEGTFGGSSDRHTGDWRTDPTSASL